MPAIELNRSKLVELMNTYCRGSYNRFARELGVDPSHLYRYMVAGTGGGKKIIIALLEFCKKRNIPFEDLFS